MFASIPALVVDWSSPTEIAFEGAVLQKFLLTLLGVSAWEVITQSPFDWSVITRKRQVHWPAAVYFWCKYSIFLAISGLVIAGNITSKINCQAFYVWLQFCGNTALGAASSLFVLRTIAIWNRRPIVMYPLILVSLAQWAILFHGIATVQASWNDVASTCVVDAVPPKFIELIYMYTMFLDGAVLVLCVLGLLQLPGRSSLWQLLFQHGIVYFVISLTFNILPVVFLLLNLNPVMNLMFTIPAVLFASIMSCRSFVALSEHRSKSAYVYSGQQPGSNGKPPGSDEARKPRAMRAGNNGLNSQGEYPLETFHQSTTRTDARHGSNGVMVVTQTQQTHDPENTRVIDLERAESWEQPERDKKSFVPTM